jgi:hypothetical protein
LQPLGYRADGLAAIIPEVRANVVAELYCHETHGVMRLAL